VAKISVPMQHHRADHSIVAAGIVQVTIGGQKWVFSWPKFTLNPVGSIHSLKIWGKVDLELLEMQAGAYLGEDDIERLENK